MSGQKAAFEERLARLGMEPSLAASAARKHRRREKPEWLLNLTHVLSYPTAFMLGVISILLSRYVMYHMSGVPDPAQPADLREIIDISVGGIVLVAFTLAFSFKTKEHLFAKFAGLWVAQCTLHNFVHLSPDMWLTAFGYDWVEYIRSTTEPSSILFRGVSIKLS